MTHAPPSFWPAPDADWRLSAELIAAIDAALTAPLPRRISKLERHDRLQARLHALGPSFGYGSRTEVNTGYRRFIHAGRFDVVWDQLNGQDRPIVFEIDSCWRHESLLKLGRVGPECLKLWIYYGQRPFPLDPGEPGFRRLNILRIQPWRLGVKDGRRVRPLGPGPWPDALHPRRGGLDVVERMRRSRPIKDAVCWGRSPTPGPAPCLAA